MFKFRSIQTSISIIGALCLVTTSTILVISSVIGSHSTQKMVSRQVEEQVTNITLDNLQNLAGRYAKEVGLSFDLAFNSARALSMSFSAALMSSGEVGEVEISRNYVNTLLLHNLKQNEGFNGTYSCWEHDALDGNDNSFKNGSLFSAYSEGSNPDTGRFTPYWTRNQDGNIEVQPLVEYDSEDAHPNGVAKGGWYQVPRNTMQESILGPLPYVVQGEQVWLATMSVPIVADDSFLGVVGADYNLDFVQQIAQQVDAQLFDGAGEVALISEQGLYIANSEYPERIGQSSEQEFGQKYNAMVEAINTGREWIDNDASQHVITVLSPITMGRSGTSWAIMLKINEALVLENAHLLKQKLAQNRAGTTIRQILISIVISAIALLVLWFAAASIARPIKRAVELAKTIGSGDLSERLSYHSKDEIGQLSNALDTMADSLQKQVDVAELISNGDLTHDVQLASENDQLGLALHRMSRNLNELVAQVQQNAKSIQHDANNVAALASDMSKGVAASAESTSEMSATITQMAYQISGTSTNAQRTSELSHASEMSAKNGNKLMAGLKSAMTEVDASGKEITNIIRSIEDIAEQTNLLALNAAIEAARAGDAGRGFSVVADEVRSLAARSSEAAKRTAELIQQTSERTVRSMALTDQTSAALEQIVNSVVEVSSLVTDIANASQEQSIAVTQVNEGITQIDVTTQKNQEGADLCANSADKLMTLAKELNTLMTRFTVK